MVYRINISGAQLTDVNNKNIQQKQIKIRPVVTGLIYCINNINEVRMSQQPLTQRR